MAIKKSEGVTKTERLLAALCERTFLKLWSYPNPYKDDGHELCDLIAVFDDQVFVFFDREKVLPEVHEENSQMLWERWKRRVVDAQVKTAHGAERYLRSGRGVFVDSKKTTPFPIPTDMTDATIHKIIVTHGAAEACAASSEDNVSGSLAVSYSDSSMEFPFPFHITMSRSKPVHLFDSHSLPLILTELDTISDFTNYLNAKYEAIVKFETLSYCGEEDLLANYLANYDEVARRHFIGSKEDGFNGVMIGEGEWRDFVDLDMYKRTKTANQVSYLWDEIIQRTSEHALDGTVLGSSPFEGKGAIQEMAKEPRFVRRGLAEHMIRSIKNFPETDSVLFRTLSFMPSIDPTKAYLFLQLKAPQRKREEENYRQFRQNLLIAACGAAKNKYMDLEIVVGILIDAPKYSDDGAEDFVVLYCSEWDEESHTHYAGLAEELGLFTTGVEVRKTIYEFVHDD